MNAFKLALAGLIHDRVRTGVSATGAAFAVLLIFMQYGFLGALQNTATLLYDRLDFDLIILSREYIELSRPGSMKRARLAEALSVPGVERVTPLTIGPALWRNPTRDPNFGGRRNQIVFIAVDPNRFTEIFLPPDRGLWSDPETMHEAKTVITRLGTVMLDRRSRPDFGSEADMPPGTMVEVSGKRVELAGYFDLGTGFSYTGLALTSEETFSMFGREQPEDATVGLVTIAPGEDHLVLAERIQARLPRELMVLTREELNAHEQRFWVWDTAIGTFMNFGALLSLFVGAIFVYQMMVADIRKHLPEYATLKAIGYEFRFLFRIVVWQAVFLAAAGYVGGLIGAMLLYDVARDAAHLPIAMSRDRLILVLVLAVGMCVGSGLVAVRKVHTADPADLF